MKYLIYVKKTKPFLYDLYKDINGSLYVTSNLKSFKDKDYILNGKIVAEFGGEAEDLFLHYNCSMNNLFMRSKTMNKEQLLKDSCLTQEDFEEYMPNYAIHINDLKIFDKPKKLSDYFTFTGTSNNINNLKPVNKMAQNMMKVYEFKDDRTKCSNILLANYILKPYILISFDPESARDILNGIKTVDIKNKILKEMKER